MRFEANAYGVVAAMRHYFGEVRKSPSPAEAFFLIERVSNVRSLLLAGKVAQTMKSARDAGLLDGGDLRDLVGIYAMAIQDGKIKDERGMGLTELKASVC